MRGLFFLFLFVSSFFAFAKSNSVGAIEKKPKSIIFLAGDTGLKYSHKPIELVDRKIRFGKNLVISGSVLLGVSPVLIFPTIQLLTTGFIEEFPARFYTGFALIGVGVLNVMAGIPMVAIGAVRWKHARKEKKINEINLQGMITKNGQVGVSLKF